MKKSNLSRTICKLNVKCLKLVNTQSQFLGIKLQYLFLSVGEKHTNLQLHHHYKNVLGHDPVILSKQYSSSH